MGAGLGRARRRTPIVESRWLRKELQRLRKEAGKQQGEAAKALGWPGPKLSMLESGKRPVHEEDLALLLELYKVPKPARAKYVGACQVARRTEWWDYDLQHSIESQLREYTGLEQAASELATFQTNIFHGLLQVPEYTAELLRARPLERLGAPIIEHLVRHRATRQDVLMHPVDPLQLHMVVLEQAFMERIGDRELMAAQIDHLVRTVSDHENVTIQIVPCDLPSDRSVTFAANYGHFTILRFPSGRSTGVVFIEQMAHSSYLYSLDDVDRYSALFERLCELALNRSESLQKMKSLYQEALST